MILVFEKFFNNEDIDQILSMWEDDSIKYSNIGAYFYFNDLNLRKDKITAKNNFFNTQKFEALRLQRYDDSIEQNPVFHNHYNPYNFIIYLNEGFEGGLLEFTNGIVIKPIKGMLVYFNENEMHRITEHKGLRWVLVGSSKNDFLQEIILMKPPTSKLI